MRIIKLRGQTSTNYLLKKKFLKMHKLNFRFVIFSKNLKKYANLQNDFFFFLKKIPINLWSELERKLNSSYSIFEYLKYILVFAILKTATLNLYPIIWLFRVCIVKKSVSNLKFTWKKIIKNPWIFKQLTFTKISILF